MARRHHHEDGDWHSLATRLDELLVAHGTADPFDAAVALLVARVAHDHVGGGPFLTGGPPAFAAALAHAAQRWPDAVEGVPELPVDALVRCSALLGAVDLRDDVGAALDAAFEALTERAARGVRGQFFTPRHVVDTLVDIVAPRPGEAVLDPACGSGAFLRRPATAGALAVGVDLDRRAIRVAHTMAALLDAPATFVRADALAGGPAGVLPGPRGQGFDVVLGNPPFAGDVGDAYPDYALGKLGFRVEREILFLERAVAATRPGGRLALVLPQKVFGTAAYAPVRRWLLERARVVGVVGLGRNTFLPHTAQKACALVAVRRAQVCTSPPTDEAVVFFVSADEGKDAGGRLRRDAQGVVLHDLAEAVAPLRAAMDAAAVVA